MIGEGFIEAGEIASTNKARSIIAAAQRVFLASGFGAASMDAIAREAGASKATIYAHFTSKQELFGAVVAHEIDRYAHAFSASELDPVDVETSLQVIADRFLRVLHSADLVALTRIIMAECSRFPELARIFWQVGPERARIQVAAFLRRAIDVGTLDKIDDHMAAEQLLWLLRGDIQFRNLLGLGDDIDEASLSVAKTNAVTTFLNAFKANHTSITDNANSR